MANNNPSLLTWNRLEARPRTREFERVLRAETRDALWFLSRQWQFGEFKGEDAGTAVQTRIEMETSSVDHISLRGRNALSYDDALPMETHAERDDVPLDLTLRQEMGRHFERILRKRLVDAAVASSLIEDIVTDFKQDASLHFSLPMVTPGNLYPEIYGDPNMMMVYAVISGGRALDGGALYTYLTDGGGSADDYVPTSTTNVISIRAEIISAGTDFVNWFRKTYNQPADAAESAWDPSHLEYQFACSAPASASSVTVMSAEEYASGHLDWYNFDIETDAANYNSTLKPGTIDTSLIERELMTVFPRKVQFPGMPHPRWWQMEDGKVDLGALNTDTTDTAKLLFGEFAMIYSNDWMVAPFDVPVGSICEVKSMVVKDVFGGHTVIGPSGEGDQTDWQRWSMFNLHRRDVSSGPADQRLFVPPAAMKMFESDPVESVDFLRDEMANMVWGVENRVPDGTGGGMDGYEASLRLVQYLEGMANTPAPTGPTLALNDADIQFQLGNSVPENWIPFIPVRVPGGGVLSREIRLQRAAMPRIIAHETPERIRPRTDLLKEGFDGTDWNPYYVYEEEVPRSGAIVKRTWQRTRWNNGAAVTWLGRRKTNGQGQGNSGLEFDTVVEKEV